MNIEIFNKLLFSFYAWLISIKGENYDASYMCRGHLGALITIWIVGIYFIFCHFLNKYVYIYGYYLFDRMPEFLIVTLLGQILAVLTTSKRYWVEAHQENPEYSGDCTPVIFYYLVSIVAIVICSQL
jgi:hypothetical protein